MTIIYIVRHCQSIANSKNLYNCTIREDKGLSETGKKQAGDLANYFSSRPVSKIYSSPFLRTRQTAAEISKATRAEIEIIEELRELYCGDWRERSEDEIREKYPEAWKGWHYDPQNNPIPGGESLLEVQARVLPKFQGVVKKHKGECVMIVTHYCVMNVLLCSLLSSLGNFRSYASKNGTIAEVSFENVPRLLSFRPLESAPSA